MNYNKGCYRQPTPYRNRESVTGNYRIQGCRTNNDRYDSCETKDMNYKLGMVYSPYQEWQNIYDCDKGFVAGTIFEELDKPFLGYKCNRGNC